MVQVFDKSVAVFHDFFRRQVVFTVSDGQDTRFPQRILLIVTLHPFVRRLETGLELPLLGQLRMRVSEDFLVVDIERALLVDEPRRSGDLHQVCEYIRRHQNKVLREK